VAEGDGGCELCAIQRRADAGEDPYGVARLSTGYVALERHQRYEGYTYFSSTVCATELDDLDPVYRAAFLHDMVEVAAAVRRAFRPRKMNYEALGNSVPHLHWHLIPRHDDDPMPGGPVWEDPAFVALTRSGQATVSDERRRDLAARLLAELRCADVTIELELAT
jgi:diadenosine tetraphosphate (Ap4A) HIT family hydrolase